MGIIKKDSGAYLIISDLQIPFEAERSLEFFLGLKRRFRIPDENCFCVGDETDQYFGSLFKKSPDASHSPASEIADTLKTLRKWYKAFPLMKVAISNHGLRWVKKAVSAEIPTQLLRSYREIIDAPHGWQWFDRIGVDSEHPFLIQHGMGYSGKDGHRNAALDNGRSTVIGHLHAYACVDHIRTGELKIWAMNAGSMIDSRQYAFEYARHSRFKACLTGGVVLDSGRTPVLVPKDL